ncbi:MAG: hypothetical protein MJK18_15155, partial [Bdellovibrionales bacterium]|nr:hypothetical protein [Bdellovibrionales bacterium]
FNFSFAMAKNKATEEYSVPKMEAAQKKVREQIRELIKSSSCQAAKDCGVLQMGNSGGCGNPDTFWAYNPQKVDKDKVTLLVKSERALAAKIQREKSKGKDMMMGTCGFKSPQALCKNNLCQIDSNKSKYGRQ